MWETTSSKYMLLYWCQCPYNRLTAGQWVHFKRHGDPIKLAHYHLFGFFVCPNIQPAGCVYKSKLYKQCFLIETLLPRHWRRTSTPQPPWTACSRLWGHTTNKMAKLRITEILWGEARDHGVSYTQRATAIPTVTYKVAYEVRTLMWPRHKS